MCSVCLALLCLASNPFLRFATHALLLIPTPCRCHCPPVWLPTGDITWATIVPTFPLLENLRGFLAAHRLAATPLRCGNLEYLGPADSRAARKRPSRKYAVTPSAMVEGLSVLLLLLLLGAMVNRTYGTHKNLYIYVLLLTVFGPIYYGPP